MQPIFILLSLVLSAAAFSSDSSLLVPLPPTYQCDFFMKQYSELVKELNDSNYQKRKVKVYVDYPLIKVLMACNKVQEAKFIVSNWDRLFTDKLDFEILMPPGNLGSLHFLDRNVLIQFLEESKADVLLKKLTRPSIYKNFDECKLHETIDFEFDNPQLVLAQLEEVRDVTKGKGQKELLLRVKRVLRGNLNAGTLAVKWPEIDTNNSVIRPLPPKIKDFILPVKKERDVTPIFSQCPLEYTEENIRDWIGHEPKTLINYSRIGCLEGQKTADGHKWLTVRSAQSRFFSSRNKIQFNTANGQNFKFEGIFNDGEATYNVELPEVDCENDIITIKESGHEWQNTVVVDLLNGTKLNSMATASWSKDKKFFANPIVEGGEFYGTPETLQFEIWDCRNRTKEHSCTKIISKSDFPGVAVTELKWGTNSVEFHLGPSLDVLSNPPPEEDRKYFRVHCGLKEQSCSTKLLPKIRVIN